MAERIMLRLGAFDFEVATAAYQRYVAKQGARWPEQERLGRYPALQFTGQTTPEITLDGVVYPGALGPGMGTRAVSIAPLRLLVSDGKPVPMVSGLGDVCGQWVVMDVADTRSVFLDNGEARKIEFSVSLRYYGPDTSASPGPANYGQSAGAAAAGGKGGSKSGNKDNFKAPASLSNAVAALPTITPNSPLDSVTAMAGIVSETVQSARNEAAKALDAVRGLAADIAASVLDAIPQPVTGALQDISTGAEAVMGMGDFVQDTLSAITAMRYTIPNVGDAGQDMGPALQSLQQGVTHIRDTARLTTHTMNTCVDTLDRNAVTWEAVGGLSDDSITVSRVAEVCRRAMSTAEMLSTLCLETDRHTNALRDKIHVEDVELSPKDEDTRREKIFATLTDAKDMLILCLPEIAAAEYGRANDRDRVGWQYFLEFITKWLHGRAYVITDEYDNGEQAPSLVPWSWLMKFSRFAKTVQAMLDPGYLFSDLAKGKLASLLASDGAFRGTTPFNYITLKPEELRAKAFQNKSMEYWLFEVIVPSVPIKPDTLPIKPDGLQVMVANTTIFALASGHTKVKPDGKKTVVVTEVAFFIHDGFEFSGDQWLGSWMCKNDEKSFDILGAPLHNKAFRDFRSRVRNYGGDFRIMCIPEIVWKGSYSYDVD